MNKKNQLPVKWMVGALIILMAVTYGTNQLLQGKHLGMFSSSSNNASPYNFFQFLANLLGLGHPGPSSRETSGGNNRSNQNGLILPRGHNLASGDSEALSSSMFPNGTALNMKASQATGQTTEQGTNNAQGENSTGNKLDIDDLESNSEYNAENNAEINAEFNGENNSEINAGINAENNPENNSEDNSTDNSTDNSQNIPGNNPGNNPGNLGDQGPDSLSPGGNGDNNPGNLPGANTNPGLGNIQNLPTINPIPSDNEVSQAIAQQNQQNEALAALIASRQALVVPAQQQAQASKYQTVTSQSIPTPSANQPPADVEAKVQAKQLMYH